MSLLEGWAEMTDQKKKDYAVSSSKVASAIEALNRHDGWQIFLALYDRKKNQIKEKRDYATIEELKGDRIALDIVDELLEELLGYIKEAQDATDLLSTLEGEGGAAPRGIMLINEMEGNNIES